MKKYFAFGMMSAMVLSFAACSSDDELANVNPNVEGKSVKTQFTISLPGTLSTRMSETETQAQTAPVFRGMDNMVLIPYAKKGVITDADSRLGAAITLSNSTENTLLASDVFTTNNSHVYEDCTIPLGTSSFLFYGKAIDNAAGEAITTVADKIKFGTLEVSDLTGEASTFKWTPVQISTATADDAKATALVAYLNLIAGTEGWKTSEGGHKELYDNFVKLQAGSSANVQAFVTDLYQSLYKNTDALSKAIVTNITNSTYVSAASEGNLTFTDAISGYPANIYLPDGAAAVKATDGTFAIATPKDNGGGTNVTALTKYVFPANLYYRANSQIKTDEASKKAEYKDGIEWDVILDKYTNDKATVDAATRSVAIIDQIQYAVARMEATFQAAAKLYDNYGLEVDNTAGFTVTGVLVGSQNSVNYLFEKTGTEDYTVYDQAVNSLAAGDTKSAPNHTLLLETAADQDIRVAVEFVNNTGKDFYGKDGIVPAGCKFYLVGSLTAADATETGKQVFKQDFVTKADFSIKAGEQAKDDDDNAIAEGKKNTNTIGLGAAYNVVPDLRTPQMELGLSVNLEWQAGHVYTVEF